MKFVALSQSGNRTAFVLRMPEFQMYMRQQISYCKSTQPMFRNPRTTIWRQTATYAHISDK